MKKKVYMAFSTDILHSGHLNILEKDSQLGELTVGVLSDEAIASYKKYPLMNLEQRMKIISSLKMVDNVVVQRDLDYTENLRKLKPDYVVHGDDYEEFNNI